MNIFVKIIRKISNVFYYASCRKNNVDIDCSAIVDRKTQFEGYNVVHPKSVVLNSFIGMGTYIHSGSFLDKCKIGRWCSIAPGVKIIIGNHPIEHVSTHPLFYSSKEFAGLRFNKHDLIEEYSYTDDSKRWYCEIGNDVWIGQDAKIMNGVKIGDGAVVGAGALVTKDIPEYAVVGGVPARIIKYRFSEQIIHKLLHKQWWNEDIETLRREAVSFCDVKKYMKDE